MRIACVSFVLAAMMCCFTGCGGGGGPDEGMPADAAGKVAAPPPGMDLMKDKMDKKGGRKK